MKVMALNPGYLAAILQIGMIVLTLSGWKREIGGDLSAGKLLFFLLASLLVSGVSVPIGSAMTLSLGEFVSLVAVMYALQLADSPDIRFRISIACLLQAGWTCALLYAHRWSTFAVLHPMLDIAIGSALIAGLFVRRPAQQYAVLWFGFTVGGLWEQGLSKIANLAVGGGAMHDLIWLSLLATRMLSLVIEWTVLREQRSALRNK